MSKGSLLCALVVLLQACVVLHLSPTASSSRLTGSSIGDVFQCQDPIRGSGLMLSPSSGPGGEFDGANSDSIFDDELAGDDEYASDDGGTPLPGGAEAVMEEEEELLPSGDDEGGGKESSGELGSGCDVECPECGKFFRNDKSMFGHLRSHPNRGYKGATPPMKNLRMSSPETDAGSPAPSSPDIAGPSRQSSGRDPQLTPFEMFCACVMLTLRCRDGQAMQQVPPPPPSFAEGKLDSVEKIEGGVGGLVASIAAAEVKSEDPGPELGNALLSDEHGGPIVKIPKKRRRSISKEDREANKVVKLVVTPKEKRPYVCKHCKAEFSTHQALGGHMAGHHRDKKIPAVVNDKETSKAHQGTAGQSQIGKQAKGDRGDLSGLSLSSRRLQVEHLSMAPNRPWLTGQASGGNMRQHFIRRNDGTTPVVTPLAADGDRRRPLNIDLNVKAPDQD